MNEVQQVIGFLLQSCAEKDATIKRLTADIEIYRANVKAEPVKPLPPRNIANG